PKEDIMKTGKKAILKLVERQDPGRRSGALFFLLPDRTVNANTACTNITNSTLVSVADFCTSPKLQKRAIQRGFFGVF
ncbi:MAG: hypothetical protein J6Y62_02200, partial [Clostridia bacterium]|nr:hypothetical protein [Clostridia bacterium]